MMQTIAMIYKDQQKMTELAERLKMKQIVIGCAVVLGLAAGAVVSPPASADGVNSSYARAYCDRYKNKIAMAAKGYSKREQALRDKPRSNRKERGSPEYWRKKYRDCLKEYGY